MSTDPSTAVPSLPVAEAFEGILLRRLSRRRLLTGGATMASVAVLSGFGLTGCEDDAAPAGATAGTAPALGFTAIGKNLADRVTVPAGYSARVLLATGDPIRAAIAAYVNDGSDGDMDQRAGDHHDAIAYFGLDADGDWDPAAAGRGLLCLNHEQITQQFLHGTIPDNTQARDETQVRKEMTAHGVAVVEVARSAGTWAVLPGSSFNRRITPMTPADIHGPVRGSAFAVTQYDPSGETARGTVNNCAHGVTPWGTYLTCEENWAGYFKRGSDAAARSSADNASLARYGLGPGTTGFAHRNWSSVPGDDFQRWLITLSGSSADGSDDYRNEANTFGWVVEIDPFDTTSRPRKRTAMGRFAHEGCWIAPAVEGQPIVFYMGDDNRNDYIYKFVSDAPYDPRDRGLAAGDKYLDQGTLYVAKFLDDGSGLWLELSHNVNGLNASNTTYPFVNQAAVVTNARLAADYVGATRMDRPEWGAVNPVNGEVYMTLTNNSNRRPLGATLSGSQLLPGPANPRAYEDIKGGTTTQRGNVNGHIIRWREDGVADALTFQWDVFLFGAQSDAAAATVNLSGLSADNDFSSPDGLWFDARGLLWIQTDDGAYTDVTNCMMLAARPGRVGDGSAATIPSGTGTVSTFVGRKPGDADLRRFLVGPRECEITGVCMTPDGTAMFVNIQHPGEDTAATLGSPATYGSRWPNGAVATDDAGGGTARPRSATIVITRDDGGVIGL